MQTQQLYINDQLVDMDDSSPIQLILQVNNLADLQTLQGNGSKSFKLPLSEINRRIFGFPDDITIDTNQVYEQLNAKFIVNGVEIISNGYAEVQDVQDKYLDIIVAYGNNDFLDKLNFQLYDMGDSTTPASGYGQNLVWQSYDHIWNVQNAAFSQQKTDGWLYPIVDFGDIDQNPPFTGHVNVRNLRPAFFLKTGIELLVKSTGYTIDQARSCLYSNSQYFNLFKKLLVMFSNSSFDHGSDYQNTPDDADGFATVLPNKLVIDQTIPYNGPIAFAQKNKYTSPYYTADKYINGTVTVSFACSMLGVLGTSKPSTAHVYISVGSGGPVTDLNGKSITLDDGATKLPSKLATQSFVNQTVSIDVELAPGMSLFVRYDIENSEHTAFIMNAGATFKFVVDQTTVLWNSLVQCERIFPAVGQMDLMKDTLQRFGLILISDPNTGTVIFISLKDIIANIPRAKDWSDKLVNMGKTINFRLGNYSQVNWLRYQNDGSIPVNFLPKYYFDDFIAINDKTLNPIQPQSDLFTSIFAPSLNRPYIGGTIAQMCSPTNTDEFAVGDEPRLLIDQKLNISSAGPGGQPISITFSDGDTGFEDVSESKVINDVISTPYFYKVDAPAESPPAGEAVHLSWKDMPGNGITYEGRQIMLPGLKSTYYPEFQNVLQRTKVPTLFFVLSPRDIAELDFTIPIFLRQYGGYFFISKIDSWVKNTPCKVTLIRL